ncbi:MAG: hypothetical protein JW795_03405 [Chitinivibrionales bacterium]|nr:hypothetical protein [Chitinivibrionales bacterium]
MSSVSPFDSLFNTNSNTNNQKISTVLAKLTDGVIDPSTSKKVNDTTSTITQPKKELGKMDFLKLLTTQLKYQDPMNPTNNADFIAQLAQFSALEGTNNVESALTKLDTSFKDSLAVQNLNALSMTNASSVSLIGKKIRIKEDSFNFASTPYTFKVHLGDASSAAIQIVDSNGAVVKTLNAENKKGDKTAMVTWDGRTDSLAAAPAGTYSIKVVGEDKNSDLYCYLEDYVSSIRYSGQGPLAKIGTNELPIANILNISEATESSKDESGSITDQNILSLLGKKVHYRQSEIKLTPDSGKSIKCNIDFGGALSATLQITDSTGAVVHTIRTQPSGDKTAQVEIPCIDFNNNGPYSIRLVSPSSATMFGEGTVDGLTKTTSGMKLRINGVAVSINDIYTIALQTQNV